MRFDWIKSISKLVFGTSLICFPGHPDAVGDRDAKLQLLLLPGHLGRVPADRKSSLKIYAFNSVQMNFQPTFVANQIAKKRCGRRLLGRRSIVGLVIPIGDAGQEVNIKVLFWNEVIGSRQGSNLRI